MDPIRVFSIIKKRSHKKFNVWNTITDKNEENSSKTKKNKYFLHHIWDEQNFENENR